MIVRHAEKPETPAAAGVSADGSASEHSLTVRGWQRAGALVPFFTNPFVQGIGVPTHVYAAKFEPGEAGESHGMRPVETASPLVEKLAKYDPAFSLNANFDVGHENTLLAEVEASGGTVLIVWEHRHIPRIATKLSNDAPNEWPENRFDLVWVFLRAASDSYIFSQVPQHLLAGDEAAP